MALLTPVSDELKKAAALSALDQLPESGVIGLGSGSTVKFFFQALAERVRGGARYVGVPTSAATRASATELGIPLLGDEGPWDIAVNVDGADEVDPALNVIKGGGAALTREKIVNASARRNIVIVDDTKLSPALGVKWPVPIEVLPFGHRATMEHLARFGAPALRDVRTDNGNLIVDLRATIEDPAALERALHAVPGVVEVGLFVGRVDLLIVASANGVTTRAAARNHRG